MTSSTQQTPTPETLVDPAIITDAIPGGAPTMQAGEEDGADDAPAADPGTGDAAEVVDPPAAEGDPAAPAAEPEGGEAPAAAPEGDEA